MANAEKAEEELYGYESESEDSVLPLMMRRREASDDDDDEQGESGNGERHFGVDRTVGESSNGLGGASPESDGEEESSTYEASWFEDEGDESGEADNVKRHFGADRTVGVCLNGESSDGFGVSPPECDGESCTAEGIEFEDEMDESEEVGVETAPVRQVFEKKELTESYVIPTVGAFYMHDDRFRKKEAVVAAARNLVEGAYGISKMKANGDMTSLKS